MYRLQKYLNTMAVWLRSVKILLLQDCLKVKTSSFREIFLKSALQVVTL